MKKADSKIAFFRVSQLLFSGTLIILGVFLKSVNIYTRIEYAVMAFPLFFSNLVALNLLKNKKARKLAELFMDFFFEFYFTAILISCIGVCLKYHDNARNHLSTLSDLIGSVIVFSFLVVSVAYIVLKVYTKKEMTIQDLHYFVVMLIGSLVAFTYFYSYIFVCVPNSFSGVDTSSAISILTDICLFTIQVFSMQTIVEIVPTCVLSKVVCIIEIVFYGFFVVIILLNIIGTKYVKSDSNR